MLYALLIAVLLFVSCGDDTNSPNNNGDKPTITSIDPAKVYQGSSVKIIGTKFGVVKGSSFVTFNNKDYTEEKYYQKWTDNEIIFVLPSDAVSGAIKVTTSLGTSNSVNITVDAMPADAPKIEYLDQAKVPKGQKIGINGSNFGNSKTGNIVQFNGAAADSITKWEDTKIVAFVPDGAKSGMVTVIRDGISSNSIEITILANPNKVDMALITKGKFTMGYEEPSKAWDAAIHEVTISYDFYMMTTEVTQELYNLITGGNPSQNKSSINNPVEQVTFVKACKFCNLLSDREKLTNCYTITGDEGFEEVKCNFSANGYRLPTEAEWEYACRAGTTGSFGGTGILSDMGWFSDNSAGNVHQVAQKQPNSFGLYDMHGNVMEWCWDYYELSYYLTGSKTDPKGPTSGQDRIARGGSYQDGEENCSSGKRASFPQALFNFNLGFRVVRKK